MKRPKKVTKYIIVGERGCFTGKTYKGTYGYTYAECGDKDEALRFPTLEEARAKRAEISRGIYGLGKTHIERVEELE